ncbi:hypothetical protein [Streptomyces sp. NPDC051684]|uniref:hypothetical protein n=1 Tax=Streptomyces sp. NPDC051684 TaxID=3365670 RepID=UPI00379B3AE2
MADHVADTPGRVPGLPDPLLGELVAWAERRLPALIDDVCAATRDRIDLYRDESVVPGAELRASVSANLRFILDGLAGPTSAPDLSAPSETGRRRARQRAPLPEVLRCYRIACAMLWDLFVEHARRVARPDVLDALPGRRSRTLPWAGPAYGSSVPARWPR